MRRLWVLFLVLVLLTACSTPATPTSPPESDPTQAPAEATDAPTAPAEAGGSLSVAGSTTVQPLAEKLSEAFTAMNPDVKIDVQGGGSSVGVKSAGGKTVDIGMASRAVKQSELDEFKGLEPIAIAYDGIAIAVNPSVGVDSLSKDQVKAIFAGEIVNWNEVGGADAMIIVVSREEGSGTRAAFEELVLGEEAQITETAILLPSNGAVRTTVSTTPDAVGYLSFGYLDSSVKAVKIDGAAPTPANAMNGSYPVVRPLNMMTMGAPEGLSKAWLDFILSEDGQAIVTEEGYISVLGAGEEEAVEAGGSLSVAGSTTVQPLAEKLSEAFTATNPDVKIDVQGGGSSVGVKSAGGKTVDIGMASRAVKQSELDEFKGLEPVAIAYDGIAIAVNPEVGVDSLSKDQVKAIFAGEIVNWNEVGGADAMIIVVAREEGSGTRAAFEELVLNEEVQITETAILLPSNGAVRTTVATTPDAVGFLSFGYLDSSVKALAIDGAAPTAANAANGSYPVVRPLNMMTMGAPEGLAAAWLDFIMSEEGQAIVADEGYIAVTGAEEAPAAEPQASGMSGTLSAAGSTTVQPLAEKLSEAFTATNPDVKIDVQGGGSSVGVKSAGGKTVDIGMASRAVKQSELDEFQGLEPIAIAYDGIAIAVNPEVGVDSLSKDQVKAIFAGEIVNWNEVGGADAMIIVVAREEGSGTRAAFEELVLNEEVQITETAILLPSNGAVRTTVATTPDAVGFLSFGYLDSSVKALAIDGAAPTAANAANGSYPVVRPLNMMTMGAPEGLAAAWLDFIMSAEGQAIVAEEGYIAVN